MKINSHHPLPFPTTTQGLQDLIDSGCWWAKVVLPPRAECERLGLEFDAEPFSVKSRQRFLATLAADPEFALAVRMMIGGVE